MEEAPPPPPPSVSARFVSENTLTAATAAREAAWIETYAKLGQEPPPKPAEEPFDGRSLWEKLQGNKDKKQEAFDEQIKFKNQFRALDEDEISFLDSLTDDNHEEEERKAQQIKDELKSFRAAVISTRTLPPPPVSNAIQFSASSVASTSASSSLDASKPASKPVVKKKVKKGLPGVIVRKTSGSGPTPSPLSATNKAVSASSSSKGTEEVGGKRALEGVEGEEGEKKRKVDV